MRELASNHHLLQRELLDSQQSLAKERDLVEHLQMWIDRMDELMRQKLRALSQELTDSDILIQKYEVSQQEYESFVQTSSAQFAAKMCQTQDLIADLSSLRTVL
jgi:hypothetical protein